MGRYLFLDRNTDPKWRMAILYKGRKPFAKATRAGKKINHSDCRRQIKLQTNFLQPVYTGTEDEIQG